MGTRTKRLSKKEQDALRYLKAVGSVWTVTATEDFFETLISLERKGLVKFIQRPTQDGLDAFPVTQTEKAK